MPKTTWLFASFFSALLLFGLLGLQLHRRGIDVREARSEAAEARKFAEAAAQTNAALAAELLERRSQVESLEEKVREAASAQTDLEKQMRAELESKDVTISELQGRLTVNILDRVLFDSGEARLKPDGEEVLQKVARILAQFPNRQVQVIGHTDNIPIRGMTRGGFSDNWDLSAGRAVAAVRFLQTKAGVDARRLAAVGYGEFHPLADNATADGRARNRRIAVVVLPEEIAPMDLPKPPAIPGATNPPPATPTQAKPAPESDSEDKPPTGQ